jgi:aminobenzoyl-glutamate utilization protein A
MSHAPEIDGLVSIRRDLHRHPEPAWREFYTTARIVEELQRIGVDNLFVGPETLAAEHRMAVPDDDSLAEWFERARTSGVDEELLERLEGGYTGAVAVLERGEGPTVALRVDIDALPILESEEAGHAPADAGFRSEHEGFMHACGHDAHATIGLGVLEAVKASDFEGTLKVFFQPGEEQIAGGKAMARSGHLDDVDCLLAVHVGLDHPTGEVVAGVEDFLAIDHFRATFTGEQAHAGHKPNEGRNAMQAMATAVQNLYAIPRHDDGPTRVNVGVVEGGTASNIIPESVTIEAEVRGETTELADYMSEHATRVIESAATVHDCEVEIESVGEAPSATSDQEIVDVVHAIASTTEGVDSPVERDSLGGSEDATYLMQEVQDNGGLAAYVDVGTDHPGGHHTPTFDVDEESLRIGIDVLTDSILKLTERQP